MSGHYLDYYNVNIYTNYYSSIGYAYVKIFNLLKFNFPVNKMFIYIDGGISNGITFSETNYQKVESQVYSVNQISENKTLRNVRKGETGFVLGLGSSIKNISCKVRIERSNGMSTNMQLGSPMMRCFLILEYKF